MSIVFHPGGYKTSIVSRYGEEFFQNACIREAEVVGVSHELNTIDIDLDGTVHAGLTFAYHTDAGYESARLVGGNDSAADNFKDSSRCFILKQGGLISPYEGNFAWGSVTNTNAPKVRVLVSGDTVIPFDIIPDQATYDDGDKACPSFKPYLYVLSGVTDPALGVGRKLYYSVLDIDSFDPVIHDDILVLNVPMYDDATYYDSIFTGAFIVDGRPWAINSAKKLITVGGGKLFFDPNNPHSLYCGIGGESTYHDCGWHTELINDTVACSGYPGYTEGTATYHSESSCSYACSGLTTPIVSIGHVEEYEITETQCPPDTPTTESSLTYTANNFFTTSVGVGYECVPPGDGNDSGIDYINVHQTMVRFGNLAYRIKDYYTESSYFTSIRGENTLIGSRKYDNESGIITTTTTATLTYTGVEFYLFSEEIKDSANSIWTFESEGVNVDNNLVLLNVDTEQYYFENYRAYVDQVYVAKWINVKATAGSAPPTTMGQLCYCPNATLHTGDDYPDSLDAVKSPLAEALNRLIKDLPNDNDLSAQADCSDFIRTDFYSLAIVYLPYNPLTVIP